MSIRSPDKNTEYLQIRNMSIVRGDTFSISIRLVIDGESYTLPEGAYATFALFEPGNKTPIIKRTYNAENQDTDKYIDVVILPYLTASLNIAKIYRYEVEYYINSGTVYTMLTGELTVIPDKITPAVRGGA